MATIKYFEDLECWQFSRQLCIVVYGFITKENFSKSYSLKNQIDSSSGSIMDNISEGFERGGRKEFIQFLGIAKGSAGEVRSQLYRAKDRHFISTEEFDNAILLVKRISSSIQGLLSYLNATEIKGTRYKVAEEQPYYFPNLKL